MKKIGLIGGGLAGLVSAILLARKGFEVTLFEEKKYPFHRVCGEYVSNEVIPFLKRHDLFPDALNPFSITHFQLTSPYGQLLEMPLDLGGFGVSRFALDLWLSQRATEAGVQIIHDRVISSGYVDDVFHLETRNQGKFLTNYVIGAFGKRSTLDKILNRPYINKRSPYIGVKYHLKTEVANERSIALHNFLGGYCGISRIEDEKYNLCYLSSRSNLKRYGSVSVMEEEVLYRNPHLQKIFTNSDFLFEKPEVINEISFSPKEPVYDHILMTGDAAGMITPLCGNGMAMAIHSAKLLSEIIHRNTINNGSRAALEADYSKVWNDHFAKRLWAGRQIQNLFGSTFLSDAAVGFGKRVPAFTRKLMAMTHGAPFN